MKQNSILYTVITFLTIVLWVYTVGAKLLDFQIFQYQLSKQHFSKDLAQMLAYVLPLAETLALIFLSFIRTRFWGFLLSFGLMLVFTVYIALVIFKYYDHVPCSCGGILNKMSWRTHFFFNLFFVVATGYGTAISYRLAFLRKFNI